MSAPTPEVSLAADRAADRAWMLRAVAEGQLGGRAVRPNPRVGCVLVAGGELVGVGHHARAGGPHAEVVALQDAGARALGATAYVTLEPCAHHGRTPPCVHALIAAGVTRVVVGMADPNPQASGGVDRLRSAGVAVELGVAAAEAARLAEVFVINRLKQRPFVRLKMACTLDGYVAARDGSTRWISGEEARAAVHLWRAQADAVLIGSGTALADNPRLDLRHGVHGAPPLRVVLDRRLRLSPDSHLADVGEQATLVLCQAAALRTPGAERLRERGVDLAAIVGDEDDPESWLEQVLQTLFHRGVDELLVEGGPTIAAALWNASLVDRLELFLAAKLVGGGQPLWPGLSVTGLDAALRLQFDEVRPMGQDVYLSARPRPL